MLGSDAHYISLECWGTLPLGISPLICPSSCAVNTTSFCPYGGVFLYSDFKQYQDSKRLAKIGWKRGAAMKENFMVSHANSSLVTMYYVKTIRKP